MLLVMLALQARRVLVRPVTIPLESAHFQADGPSVPITRFASFLSAKSLKFGEIKTPLLTSLPFALCALYRNATT